MRFPHGDSVEVWRSGPPDRYGDRTFVLSHNVSHVGIAYPSTTENDDRREQVIADAVLYAHDGDDITSSDRVRLPDGSKYSVIGKPLPRKSPFSGWLPGVVIQLRAVEG